MVDNLESSENIFERLQCLGSDVEVLDEDDDVGGVFLLGLVSILPGKGFQKVCGRASSLEKRPGGESSRYSKCLRMCPMYFIVV